MKYYIIIVLGCYSPNLDGGFRCENRNLCPPNQQCCWDRVCRPECTDPPEGDASLADRHDLGKEEEILFRDWGIEVPDAQPPPDLEPDMNPCQLYQRVLCKVESDCDEACGLEWSCMGDGSNPPFCGLH